MHERWLRASAKTSRIFASVSPWYAEESSGPFTMRTAEPVEAAIARARWVLPVPGGPWSRMPRGGLSPVVHGGVTWIMQEGHRRATRRWA